MDYQTYIHSEKWRVRRLSKLEQAKHKCEKCGERDGLSVHHLNYNSLGHEASEDLIVLCQSCHWLADEIRKGLARETEQKFYAKPQKSVRQLGAEIVREQSSKPKKQTKRKNYGTEYARSWLDELRRK